MKTWQSRIVILLVAICAHLVDSQDCSMHKVQIICKRITRVNLLSYSEDHTFLTCFGDDSINSTFPGSSVSSVLHSNGTKVSNPENIEAVVVERAKVQFIPTGIASKLPNLKVLAFSDSNLVAVNKENLREFGDKLEAVVFSGNKIASIDADLFMYNLNLQFILFERNPIKNINPEFFTNLKKLKSLKSMNFESAGCMDETQDFDIHEGHDIATFEWNYENCTDGTALFETQKLIKASLCEEAKTSTSTSEITENNERNTAMVFSQLGKIAESINYLSVNLSARISALEEVVSKIEKKLE